MSTRCDSRLQVGPALQSHPTVRLSHIQHTESTPSKLVPYSQQDLMVEKSRYHASMTKTVENEFNQQLTKAFAPRGSRDTPKKLSSLAATHPANYTTQASEMMPPPPRPGCLPCGSMQATPSPTSMTQSRGPFFDLPPVEVPWRQYNDPMWQTSSDPHFWGMNRTILKSDSYVDPGNVVSPTWMIGLPFGGMTEMAMCYPHDDQRRIHEGQC